MSYKLLQSNRDINRSDQFEDTLQRLGKEDKPVFKSLKSAMTFCAFLGFREGRRIPLSDKHRKNSIAWAQYNDDNIDALYTLACAEKGDVKILSESGESEMIEIYEQYANGGLSIVEKWFDRYSESDTAEALIKGLANIGIKAPVDTVDTIDVDELDF